MSERASNSEYEPQQMSVMRRYYNDLKYIDGRYANVISTVGNVIENTPVRLDTNLDQLMRNEYKDIEWQLEYEPRIATERLALLPIIICSDKIDNSDLEVTKAQRWYRDTIEGISHRIKDNHPINCFDVEDPNHRHQMCQLSTDCPRIFIKQYLVTEFIEPNFSTEAYMNNSRRMYEIMRTKNLVATKHEFLERDYANELFSMYTRKYNDYLSGRWKAITSGRAAKPIE